MEVLCMCALLVNTTRAAIILWKCRHIFLHTLTFFRLKVDFSFFRTFFMHAYYLYIKILSFSTLERRKRYVKKTM